MRKPVLLALFAALAALFAANVYAKKSVAWSARPARQWSTAVPKRERIEHALNRLTFGPRPGDEARVKTMGLNRWIELQLHPGRIPENPLLVEKLKTLDTLRLTSAELVRDYPTPQTSRQVVARDLAEAKTLRAVYGARQLEEVLDDFWFNHFNVFLDKGADRYLVTAYEREAIRPHVLGKFRDLLEATASSPAMLFYLDNWESGRRGLNENYGRELMELHTLGVNGGYTQKDVTEVARCFTGWTIRRPQRGGEFVFNPRLHDDGEKIVLGVRIAAGGGQSDGEKVLDILASHPATAHFISRKLAMRFVADDPPESLVNRMAETFGKTGGDIQAVLETMLRSKEFWSEGAYRSKMKSPLEMVASAVRAADGDVGFALPLANQVAQLGEPLYRKIEPTGYSNAGREWMNSAGLMARMNFALQLAGNRIPGVKVETADADREGMALGSPEFQKR